MTFYLPNPDVQPIGTDAAEFLDLPRMSEHRPADAQPDDPGSVQDRFGFLRVRLSDDVQLKGYVSAYMVDGTQVTVRTRDVLHTTDEGGGMGEGAA